MQSFSTRHTKKRYIMTQNLRKGLMLCIGIMAAASLLFADEVQQSQKKSLLPDYKQKVGFTYGLGADIVSNYIWRGLYVGGLGVQADANVGYGGLFLDMWWNIGACDWTFQGTHNGGKGYNTPARARVDGFNPEVDMTLGFSRWGLTVMFMHMYYFDTYTKGPDAGKNSRYFDFGNHAPGDGGITQEWRIKYRVSDALPISILWCTRTWGRDGYINGNGELQRAYSSYLELGYDIFMPHNLCLEARAGLTPWKSMYTGFQGDFAFCNVSAKLNWHRDLGDHCMMTAFANLMINPYDMATDFSINGSRNPFLWNIGCGFYLK